MTPIDGLNALAEADGFAMGGVTGPIAQGSLGGVPIVKPDVPTGAGAGAASAKGAGGCDGAPVATGPTPGSAGAIGAGGGLLCAVFSCVSRRLSRAS